MRAKYHKYISINRYYILVYNGYKKCRCYFVTFRIAIKLAGVLTKDQRDGINYSTNKLN